MDLASWREEGVSQFPSDAVEAVVQVGLQTVRVVNGVEACQDTDTDTPVPHYLCTLLSGGVIMNHPR